MICEMTSKASRRSGLMGEQVVAIGTVRPCGMVAVRRCPSCRRCACNNHSRHTLDDEREPREWPEASVRRLRHRCRSRRVACDQSARVRQSARSAPARVQTWAPPPLRAAQRPDPIEIIACHLQDALERIAILAAKLAEAAPPLPSTAEIEQRRWDDYEADVKARRRR